MTPRERFLGLLKNDILKLDLAELNFGVYRILNARRDLVLEFLDHELPALIETQLAQIPGAATEDEEGRIYAALDTFFHRYWDDGDFILRPRRGRDAAYSVPYDGSDIYFHWATKGSHYVKSGEFLKSYAFKPENAGGEIRFEITAAQQEKDNVKGAKRYFVPAGKAQDGATQVFRFEYRPLDESETKRYDIKGSQAKTRDTGENGSGNGGENGGGQLAPSKVQDRLLRAWLDGSDFKSAAVPAALRGAAFDKHVARYVRRQTSDFFVHPNLGPFLEGELDYFLKNEFLQIWDRESPEALARERTKFNIVRGIGQRIIAFLHQIEDFQARLFEKRKFILRTDWLVMASALAARTGGKALVENAAANKQQVAEWRRWVGDDALSGRKLLEKFPHLPIHTAHFDQAFVLGVLSCFDDIETELGGVLVHGENYASLRSLEPNLSDRVGCIHIDPPYNTDTSGFAYKNSYKQSSWACFMQERVIISSRLLKKEGQYICHIDENEYERLNLLFDELPLENLGTVIWDKRNPLNGNIGVANQHEYIIWRAATTTRLILPNGSVRAMLAKLNELVANTGCVNETVRKNYGTWVSSNPNLSGGEKAYRYIDDDGNIYQSVSLRAPEPRTDPKFHKPLIHPTTGKGCAVPPNGFSRTPETLQEMKTRGEIIFGPDETTQPRQKVLLTVDTNRQLSSVIQDAHTGKADLSDLGLNFPYSHPESLYELIVDISSDRSSLILDFFSGSGTTAHATICLNRKDGGRRRFTLIDQETNFDSVLLPRIAKVMACPDWKDGKPAADVDYLAEDDDHWSRRTLPLVKVLRIERYEDSLDALETRDEYDARRAGVREMAGADYTLRYLLEEETRGSALFAPGRLFEAPFSAQLPVHTPGGVKPVNIDLAESTLAMLGLRLVRVFEASFENRRYRFMCARTRADALQLVVLRDLTPAPETKFWEREYRWLAKTVEARWGSKLSTYARIWYNGDTMLLDNEAGSSIDAEFARVMQERDPHATAG